MSLLPKERFGVGALFILALLNSCAQNSGPDSSQTGSDLGANSTDSASGAQLSCDPARGCSPAVGWMTLRDGGEITHCAATLVGEDLVVTASHCLPDELRSPRASCSDKIDFHFAATAGSPETHVACARVLSASALVDRTRAQTDIAFLKLASRVKRPFLKMSHLGVVGGEKISVIKIEPTQQTRSSSVERAEIVTVKSAEILKEPCRAIFGSEALPGSNSPESSVLAFGECTIDHVSEGAPLINENGEIRGVVQAMMPKARLDRRIGSRKLLERTSAPISIATNLACVRFPEKDEDFAFSARCQDNPNERSDAATKELNRNLQFQFSRDPALRVYFRPANSKISWTSHAFWRDSDEGMGIAQAVSAPSADSLVAIPVPGCVSPGVGDLDQNLKLPALGFQIGLDRYLVPNLDHSRSIGTVSAHLEIEQINASSINDGGDGTYRIASLFVEVRPRSWVRVLRAELSVCPSTVALESSNF